MRSRLWEAYTLSAFAAVGSEPSVIVSYGDLLRDPVATTTRLIEQLAELEVQGLRTPSEREVAAFIERDLHRQRRARVDRAGYLNEQQAALAGVGDDLRLPTATEVAAVSPGAASMLRAFEESEKRRADLEAEQAAYGELQQTLRRVEETTSPQDRLLVRGSPRAGATARGPRRGPAQGAAASLASP